MSSILRMSRKGANILDKHGRPWVGRGQVWGRGELMTDQDGVEDAATGANFVRIMARAQGCGTYQAPTIDGAPNGTWLPEYKQSIYERLLSAKRAKLKTCLAFEGNCPQNGNQNPDFTAACAINGTPGQNMFTPLGATWRSQWIDRGSEMIDFCQGLADIVEVGSELDPRATGGTQIDVNELHRDCIAEWVTVDKDLIFGLGGLGYAYHNVAGPIVGAPTYASDNIVLLFNLLNACITNPAVLQAAIAFVTRVRAQLGYPLYCDQVGATQADDPSGALLAAALAALIAAPGGSISFTCWTKVDLFATSFGEYWDSGKGAGRQPSVAHDQLVAVKSAAFTAPVAYPV